MQHDIENGLLYFERYELDFTGGSDVMPEEETGDVVSLVLGKLSRINSVNPNELPTGDARNNMIAEQVRLRRIGGRLITQLTPILEQDVSGWAEEILRTS